MYAITIILEKIMPYKNKENQKKWRMENATKIKEGRIRYFKENAWVKSYENARARCVYPSHHAYHRYGGRGIKFQMTIKDFKKLWFRDKAYLLKNPSIDRVDNDGHYALDNCRYIEWSENSRRTPRPPSAKRIAVEQIDLKSRETINTFTNIKEAMEITGVPAGNICRVLQGERNKAGGFFWSKIQ